MEEKLVALNIGSVGDICIVRYMIRFTIYDALAFEKHSSKSPSVMNALN